MTRDVICPTCGTPVPIGPEEPITSRPEPAPDGLKTTDSPLIEAATSASTSGDNLGALSSALATPEPDPILVAIPSVRPVPHDETSPPDDRGDPEGRGLPNESRSVLLVEETSGTTLGSRDEAMEAIPVDVEGPRRPRLMLLLMSYASAMTLACLWLVVSGRSRPAPPPTLPEDSRPDLGLRGDRSETVAPPAPILAERVVRLGQTLRVGSLEVAPLEVRTGPVTLERLPRGRRRETRDGGEGCLILTLRLRNLTEDAIFAPMDEAFFRDPDRGLPDSFLVTDRREPIYGFPLAAESEWSVVDQEFRALKPGEAIETIVVSAPGAVERATTPLTWRLKLRTGPDRIDLVGVRFDPGEVRTGSEPGRSGASSRSRTRRRV